MKRFLLLMVALVATSVAFAADEPKAEPSPWTKVGSTGLNLSQMSLANWAAGGDPSVAADLSFNYSLDYKKDQTLWQNRLELAYGINRTESNGTRKTNDKIYFSSSYGRKAAESLYISALLKFNTQFANGFDYAIKNDDGGYKLTSDFMAPAYLSGGLGIVWTPFKWLSVNASPSTWKATVVTVESLRTIYGVAADRSTRHEFGGNVQIEAKGTIWGDLSGYTRLNLFSNYLANPQNVDVDWSFRLDMKINKWLSANVTFHAIYDDDIKIPQENGVAYPCLQMQEVAGIGLLLTF